MKLILKASNFRNSFQYDTTFNLTGLYVSIISWIHPFLQKGRNKGNVPVPLFYYFHERKSEITHNFFWNFICQEFEIIKNKGWIVTDCEDSFRNSIKRFLPEVPLIRCWKHLFKSIEFWLRANGGKLEDVGFYTE